MMSTLPLCALLPSCTSGDAVNIASTMEGVEVLAKPPNRVWGEACNVTDKSPIKPGARRVARRCYKRAEVSWVWPVLAILVKVSRVRYKAIWRFGAI